MTRTVPSLAAAVLVLAASAPAPAFAASTDEPKLDLRPRFTVGQQNRFVVDMHSKTESQLLDKPQVKLEEYQQRIRLNRKVIEAGDSGATLEIRYEAVVVNLVAGTRSVYFDSEAMNGAEAEESLGSGVRNAMARTFTVKVDPFGRVLSVAGNVQDGLKVASANLIGDDLFKRSLLPIYGPGKDPSPTAIGETWSTTRQSAPSQTGQFTTTITSTLTGVDVGGVRAAIDIGGSIVLDPSEKAKVASAEISTHKIAGQQFWNLLTGVFDRSAFMQSMQLRAEVEVTTFEQRERKIRPRRVDTLLHVVIQRIDDGISALPPLAAQLTMPPLVPPPTIPDMTTPRSNH